MQCMRTPQRSATTLCKIVLNFAGPTYAVILRTAAVNSKAIKWVHCQRHDIDKPTNMPNTHSTYTAASHSSEFEREMEYNLAFPFNNFRGMVPDPRNMSPFAMDDYNATYVRPQPFYRAHWLTLVRLGKNISMNALDFHRDMVRRSHLGVYFYLIYSDRMAAF